MTIATGKKGGKKGKKGKKEKDLTPDRTINSLYEELVSEGIIVRHNKVNLGTFYFLFNSIYTSFNSRLLGEKQLVSIYYIYLFII